MKYNLDLFDLKRKKVILAKEAMSVFVHEFSHFFEADIFLMQSKNLSRLDTPISLIDIHESPLLPAYKMIYDDEGTRCADICLLKEGRIQHVLADLKWHKILKTPYLSGNGRGKMGGLGILPRMRISSVTADLIMQDDFWHNEEEDCVHIEQILGGKLDVNKGMTRLQVLESHVFSAGCKQRSKPFFVEVDILKLINNIDKVSGTRFAKLAPCFKLGQTEICGIIAPEYVSICWE